MRVRRVCVAALATTLLAAAPAGAATITVTTEADGIANDGQCSLREATRAALLDAAGNGCSAGSGADTIELPAGFYVLTVRGGGENQSLTGDLDLTSVTLHGAGPATTVISGGGIDRVVDSVSGTNAVEHVTITGGHAIDGADGQDREGAPGTGGGSGGTPGLSGPGGDGASGGGLHNAGGATLALTDVIVSSNSAGDGGQGGDATGGVGGPNAGPGGDAFGAQGGIGGGGGGIHNSGTLSVTDSVVIGNRAGDGGPGGAGTAGAGGSGGSVNGGPGGEGDGGGGGQGGSGGGIFSSSGSVEVTRSRLQANSAGTGGAGGVGHGGDGGAATTGTGGTSGNGNGGAGGNPGAGGALAALTNVVTIGDSTLRGNGGGDGGTGGTAISGNGGNATTAGGHGGSSGTPTGGISRPGGPGGGIAVSAGGTLDVSRSTLEANRAGAGGDGGPAQGGDGGDSVTAGNAGGTSAASAGNGSAGGDGGAVSRLSGVTTTIVNSTVTANASGRGGDGGNAQAGTTGSPSGGGVGGSGFGGNGGDAGSAGAMTGAASLTHSTIAANSASAGAGAGGPASGGPTPLTGFAGATSGDGGGFRGVFTFANTIISANVPDGCGIGTYTDNGHNFSFPDAACPGTNSDPLLGPLADNGGPTRTMALGAGSPAIDAVPATGANCQAVDQRNLARPAGAACDGGAYEVTPPAATTNAATGVTATGATLHGTVNPNLRATTVRFQYGSTTAYGQSTADQSVASPQSVSAALSGLAPGKAIHYRVVATSADGSTTGGDQAFTTTALPPPPFAGVTLKKQTVKVKKNAARIKVSCPAAAQGSCAGKLTLKGVGSRKFTIAAGKTASVSVKLSKAARSKLKRRGKIATTATALAHDSRKAPNVKKTARVTLKS